MLIRIFFITILFCFCSCVFAQELVILHTNDVHGRLAPVEYRGIKNIGGFARRVAYFNSVRKEDKNVLIFDAGDYYQGSIYYRLYKGFASAALLKYAKYDAMTFGNHEFDEGISHLKKLVAASKAPYVSTNLRFCDKYLTRNVKKSMIFDINGEKILVLGATTPDIANLTNSSGIEVLDTVKELNNAILKAKADYVILISHCGAKYDKYLAQNVNGIDVILGGHNHYFFNHPKKVNGAYIFQEGEFGVDVGKILVDTKYGLRNFEQIWMTDDRPEDLNVKAKLAKYDKAVLRSKNYTVAKLKAPIFALQDYIESHQSYLGQIILCSMAPYVPDFDVIFINSGSIRVNRNLKDRITYADVLEILPFDNKIAYGDLKGSDLKILLEEGKRPGRSYLQIIYKARNIEDDKYYRVATSDYIMSGKDGYTIMENTRNVKIVNLTQFDAFMKYLQTKKILEGEVFCEAPKQSKKLPNEEAKLPARGLK